jgi:hypothetical protein
MKNQIKSLRFVGVFEQKHFWQDKPLEQRMKARGGKGNGKVFIG